ncbi:MAG: L-histidine N(alpha)-methyltransferase [Verrucomicrobiota bacterium]
MSRAVLVKIHPSQFPENIRQDLLQSLRSRQINHKFHYDSIKQTQKWLALHQAYSPSRTDPDCSTIYDQSFARAAEQIETASVHLVGLGCGGGQKDTRLLQLLRGQGKELFYTPCDVSVAMVLVAQQTARSVLAQEYCFPFVCDIGSSNDAREIFSQPAKANARRLLTFFGMIPNFEPQIILPKLSALLRPEDLLLFSANLAPGTDYSAGVQKILPLYDNEQTRSWLLTFLTDLGVEKGDGDLTFCVEDCPAGTLLKRVAAYFNFQKTSVIELPEERFEFGSGQKIRLFFSYRHTPKRIALLLAENGITVLDQWITKSEEEGVFLCRKLD